MSTPQELIDFLNADITELEANVAQKTQQKSDLDVAIAQQQANIDYFNTQKTQCDADIATYDDGIAKNNEIIAILEASLEPS
jgi:septal ring factor EnvC (AmiA/AmiB activator)